MTAEEKTIQLLWFQVTEFERLLNEYNFLSEKIKDLPEKYRAILEKRSLDDK